jgi:hypothetical protein
MRYPAGWKADHLSDPLDVRLGSGQPSVCEERVEFPCLSPLTKHLLQKATQPRLLEPNGPHAFGCDALHLNGL